MTLQMRDSIRPSDLLAWVALALSQTAGLGIHSSGWATVLTNVGNNLDTAHAEPNLSITVTGGGSGLTLAATSLDDSGNAKTYTLTLAVS